MRIIALTLLLAGPAIAEEAVEPAGADAPKIEPELAQPASAGLPLQVGLELGEPTALTVAYGLNPAGRVTAKLGLLHRAAPYSFALETPMMSVGYQHDLFNLGKAMGRDLHLTAGGGLIYWPRKHAVTMRPMMVAEVPIGLRFTGDSPLVIAATLAPQIGLVPALKPAVVASLGFSWSLGGAAPAPAPAPEPAEPEEAPEPESKPESKKTSGKKRR